MAWAVNVRIMSSVGLIFYVCRRDCDASLALLRRFIDSPILEVLSVAFLCLSLRDGSCESGLGNIRFEDLVEERVRLLFRDRRDRSYLLSSGKV